MALWFPIMVNGFTVGRVELVRQHPLGLMPAEGEMCTYRLGYFNESGSQIIKTTVSHPYLGGNPIPLLSLALNKLAGNYQLGEENDH